ncbi:uncharacterized protein LOC120335581 [Styela clava]
MKNLEFTDDEIWEQLENLGYFDVSHTRLRQKIYLQRLVEHDRSSGSSSWFTGNSSPSTNSDASPSNQRQEKPSMPKPNLSRYQPHIQVSPRRMDPSTLGTSGQTRTTTAFSSSSGLDTSPETHVKTVDDSPLGSSDESPLPRQPRDFTATITTSNDIPTSYDRHDNDDEVTGFFGYPSNSDDITSHGRFQTTGDITPVTPTTSVTHELPTSSERRVIRRRKVLRKQQNGESAVFDESLVADGMNENSYRLHDISMDDMAVSYDRERLATMLPPRPHTARPLGRKADQEFIHDQPLPSYIRPNTVHPHTRNIKKSDPVNRYHQYRDVWNSIKAPGEKSHKDLRWEVKAQMLYKDEPQPKPQRIYVPNTYVVPTSKKRSALRWEVRHALERGMPVPSTYTVL